MQQRTESALRAERRTRTAPRRDPRPAPTQVYEDEYDYNDEPRAVSHNGHVDGVEATAGGLIRSTLIAAAGATALIVCFYLPAEYGIDPTGVGTLTGLTTMGEIKQQLYAEAAMDEAAAAGGTTAAVVAGADPQVLARLDSIEAQLSAIAGTVGVWARPTLDGGTRPAAAQIQAAAARASAPAAAAPVAPAPVVTPAAVAPPPAAPARAAGWRDEASYTLPPGEGIEVKLVMRDGETARFQWTANGSVVNFDTHGDGGGQKISYEKGRSVGEQEGELTAAFTGNHGWFWRNRTDEPVRITVRTAGEYSSMKKP